MTRRFRQFSAVCIAVVLTTTTLVISGAAPSAASASVNTTAVEAPANVSGRGNVWTSGREGQNYFVGDRGSSTEARNWFVFTIPQLTDPVIGVRLSVDNNPGSGSFSDWVINDVSSLAVDDPTLFNDIGSGDEYGRLAAPPNNATEVVQFNAAGEDAVQAVASSGGTFIVGGRLVPFTTGDTMMAGTSGKPSSAVQLLITTCNGCPVTTTNLGSSGSPSNEGDPVTFTATVATSPPGFVPGGYVEFIVDGLTAAQSNVDTTTGQAQFVTSTLTASGSPHSIKAAFHPTGVSFRSSGTISQTVNSVAPPPPTTPVCQADPPTSAPDGYTLIVGTNNSDAGTKAIKGTKGNDLIYARGGNDEIKAGRGDDVVCGGGGDDIVNADGGNDTVYGEGGKDELRGEGDNDSLIGGGARDTLIGGDGADTCTDTSETTFKKCETIGYP